MEEKIRIELTVKELNEIYYVLGSAISNRNLMMVDYNLLETIQNKISNTIHGKEGN